MIRSAVAVVGTGGTIAGLAGDRVSFHRYRGGALKVDELVAELRPELAALAEVTTEEFHGASPPGLVPTDYPGLTARVEELLAEVDAVVVCSGSQLLEELAYWLDLTVHSGKPVVVTGSIRPWNVLGSDGPANLYNAVALAASGRTTGFGTVVLFNDEVFAARDVTKTSSFRVHAFESRPVGVLGAVDGEHIRLPRTPAPTAAFDLAAVTARGLPEVEIAATYAGAGRSTIDGPVAGGAAGVVVAGDPSADQLKAVRDALDRGVVFVAAGRPGISAAYDTRMPGVPSAEGLLPHKARLLLMLSLAAAGDREEACALFSARVTPQF
ncbi:asparaginase domain-containing protein [Amycolatopsis sp. 195334CR]|uniref:asparaginase domain-containing protein n=1 Tax=Amycolatopsis sp. 195334CR TaxID=2814588 RepID=UPI001A907046|nr:asparaginase domain-containing protein [Amycolatopsis sp. 195334CR]MBN6033682.1 asparaginase [Amycolatopsis sp. 195334CR]